MIRRTRRTLRRISDARHETAVQASTNRAISAPQRAPPSTWALGDMALPLCGGGKRVRRPAGSEHPSPDDHFPSTVQRGRCQTIISLPPHSGEDARRSFPVHRTAGKMPDDHFSSPAQRGRCQMIISLPPRSGGRCRRRKGALLIFDTNPFSASCVAVPLASQTVD